MTFDLFDDLVSRDFEVPARRARQAAAINQARVDVNRLFGDFLRQAADDDEFHARLSLVAAEMQPIWQRHGVDSGEQKIVVDSLKVADSWEDPAHKSDNCCTDEPLQNPAVTMPWGEAGPTPKQVKGEDDDNNDATLHHVASWFTDDPVSGVDFGDSVVITNDAVDSFSGRPVPSGEAGVVQDVNGGDVTVDVGGQDFVVPVQDIEKVGNRHHAQGWVGPALDVMKTVGPAVINGIGDLMGNPDNPSPTDVKGQAANAVGDFVNDDPGAPTGPPTLGRVAWTWDSESNAYKSSGTSTFGCPCGRAISGVGQHRCVCGKVWNMSSVINGSKTAQDFPVYSCREVETDPRLVLADVQNNGTGNDPAKGGPGEVSDDPEQEKLKMDPKDPRNIPPSPAYLDPYRNPYKDNAAKGARVARILEADAGLWPLLDDKDIQANWKALMGIILNPAQVSALEHEQYQQLIQELYEEITRRGLDSAAPDQNSLMDPGLQLPAPSPTALACRRMGYNAALAGVTPAVDEPLECFQGWVLGLNQRIADSYSERTTEYEGSEPVTPGEDPPPNNDNLTYKTNPNITDPTPGERADFARDTDDRNDEGQSDEQTATHVEDFEPETEKNTESIK